MFSHWAPGSVMLLGEHAVLQGHKAVVAALDQGIHVTLIPNTSACISIQSALGSYETLVTALIPQAPFQFVLTAIGLFAADLPSGFYLEIRSELSEVMGFGTSAAVTVATIAVIRRWLGHAETQLTLYKLAYQVIQRVQGCGSGADVAASVFGGILSYQRQPLEILPLPVAWPSLWLVYSGYKTPTTQVLAQVAQRRAEFPTVIEQIENAMGAVSTAALVAIRDQNWPVVGALMNTQQGLMAGLGVSDLTLETFIYGLRALPNILGAKISGSGLGDCVLALGNSTEILLKYPMAYKIQVGHVL